MGEQSKGQGDEATAVLGFLVIALGLLAYWWWQLGDAGRLAWLRPVGDVGGHGPPPSGLGAQFEWLLLVRAEDLKGMLMLFVLAVLAGAVEGSAGRQTVALSGFGLRPLKAGRGLALAWLGLVVAAVFAPLPLPYVWTAVFLAALLGAACYLRARGRQRVQ
ncbi:MAG: hypothetical protein OXP66_07105 [Candidatus Tectomicrobia bacterium]|nr:hypothetical protein [Candidatus Tectomicrobia bacterium]